MLGVTGDDLVFLPHDDRSLVLCVATLVDELTELLQRTGVPDEVLVTSALDGHTDHVALQDAARRLRRVLGDAHRRGGDIGAAHVLRRYERQRLSENTIAARALDAIERVFDAENAGVATLRGAALGAVTRIAPLRELIVAVAAGRV